MSNHKKDEWEPSCLRLEASGAAPPHPRPRGGRRLSQVHGKFIKGPLDVAWLAKARKLGVTALWVALGLLYIRGLRRTDSFLVSNLMMQGWGVLPDAKSRALKALEKACLITIERRGKRSPAVTLIVG
jgi:hypothetical protein